MYSKILVVDDLEANLCAISNILAPLNAVEIVNAKSGSEALELIKGMPFALILLDLNVPDMMGYELAERIAQAEEYRDTPIIMLSTHKQGAELEQRVYQAGVVDAITKPLTPHILLNKVKQFVSLDAARIRTDNLCLEREAILDAVSQGVVQTNELGQVIYSNLNAIRLTASFILPATVSLGHLFKPPPVHPFFSG